MTTVHLSAGGAGAGKTTYARRLAEAEGGVHLSIDDWMVTLYGPDAPDPPSWPWIAERLARCERVIVATAVALGHRGVPAVLDLSFLQAAQRERVATALREEGLSPRLHVLDVPAEERWARVQARNLAKGETYRVAVTRPMFDHVDRLWEAPAAEEMERLGGVRVEAGEMPGRP